MSILSDRHKAWLRAHDRGVSSMTIFSILSGHYLPEVDASSNWPHDPADFGRCHRLLMEFPEWRERLGEVADARPAWQPFVANWDEMTRLFRKKEPTGIARQLYDFMQPLDDTARELSGWTRTGPNSWERVQAAGGER